MRIFVGQIYIKPGVSFPFSLGFQKWLSDELTQCVEASEYFKLAYSEEFGLSIRISAKSDIHRPEIKGPIEFERAKHVEYTIFLPHERRDYHDADACIEVVRLLLQAVVSVLEELIIDPAKVRNNAPAFLAHFLATPELMEHPKPPDR